MVEAIEKAQTGYPFDLWAWVIMPEHFHFVVFPHRTTKIADILKSIKQSVSKRAIFWLSKNCPEFLMELEDIQPNGKKSCRFWQRGGGYDRNLRSTRDIHEKIIYIHENPVRRGLVERPADYRWSSARAWETGIDQPLRIDRGTLPPLTVMDDRIDSRLMQ